MLCGIFFIPFMWLDVMICLVIQIENYICKRFTLWSIYVYLGLENQLIFGLPVKELSLIIMDVVVWDTTVFFMCLGEVV